MTPEEIAARLSALEEELRALRAQLSAAPARGAIRETRQCPVCQANKILHIEGLRGAQNSLISVAAAGAFVWSDRIGVVQFYVCATCGYGEAQFSDPAALEGQKHVRVLEALPESEEPYR